MGITMANLREHIIAILEELKRIQAIEKFPNLEEGFPGLMSTGDRGSFLVTQKIEREVKAIASILLQNDSNAARQFTMSEWKKLVRQAFGLALGGVDLDHDLGENAETILVAVRKTIGESRKTYGPLHCAVGCTLFGNLDVKPIVIGPVRIETREDWLERNKTAGAVTSVIAKRLQRLWSSGRKSKKLIKHIDQIREQDVIDAIGNCPFVCSIQTDGLAPETGKDKALMAGRMALAAISLLWQKPSTALDGFRLSADGDVRVLKVLTFIPGKVTIAGQKLSHLPTGYTFKPGEWNAQAAGSAYLFEVAGKILEFFLHPNGQVARPALMNTLMQALLWFHEGCRETIGAMAVVKFASVLDALSCGGEVEGIRKLLTARVGFKDDSVITKSSGLTMKQAVDQLYRGGRSRTVHGTNEKLMHDWEEMRNLAEILARLCLVSSMYWAFQNPSEDDPRKLSTP